MKRLILAISLIAATIIISLASLGILGNTNERMFRHLDEITEYAELEDYNALNSTVKETSEQWEKEKPLLNILIGQTQTNEITDDLRMIELFALEGNKESVLLYVYECKTTLERIKSTNDPSLSTIL